MFNLGTNAPNFEAYNNASGFFFEDVALPFILHMFEEVRAKNSLEIVVMNPFHILSLIHYMEVYVSTPNEQCALFVFQNFLSHSTHIFKLNTLLHGVVCVVDHGK